MNNNEIDSNNILVYETVTDHEQQNRMGRKEYKKILCKCGLFLSLTAIAIFVVQAIIIIISYFYFKPFYKSDWFELTVTAVGMLCGGLPICYILMKRIPDSEHGEKTKLSIGAFIEYFIICVSAMYISSIASSVISSIIEAIKGAEVVNPLEDVLDNSNLIITILYASILGPIAEELIFRKFLLNKLRRFGDAPAILISGIGFGLFHMNLSQLFYAATVGMILAYVTLKTNTVKYAILLHMMLNFMGSGITALVLKTENIVDDNIFSLWSIAAVIAGFALFVRRIRNIELSRTKEVLVKESDYILNAGTIIFIIICIVIIVFETVR